MAESAPRGLWAASPLQEFRWANSAPTIDCKTVQYFPPRIMTPERYLEPARLSHCPPQPLIAGVHCEATGCKSSRGACAIARNDLGLLDSALYPCCYLTRLAIDASRSIQSPQVDSRVAALWRRSSRRYCDGMRSACSSLASLIAPFRPNSYEQGNALNLVPYMD